MTERKHFYRTEVHQLQVCVQHTYADGDVAHGTYTKKGGAAAYAAAAPGTQRRV